MSRCRPSVASAVRKSAVGSAVRAPIRSVSPSNYVRAGFNWNSRGECTTLSVIHLAGKTNGSSVRKTTTVPSGGPGWKAPRRKGFRWRGAQGLKKMDGARQLASSTCRMCDVGRFAHTLHPCSLPRMDLWHECFPDGRQDCRNLQNREYRYYSLIPRVIRFGEYLATGHSPSMGFLACTENSRE